MKLKKCYISFCVVLTATAIFVVLVENFLFTIFPMRRTFTNSTNPLLFWESGSQRLEQASSVYLNNRRYHSLIELTIQHLYIYSAVAVHYHTVLRSNFNIEKIVRITEDRNYHDLVLIGWEHESLAEADYQCCVLSNDGNILTLDVYEKRHNRISAVLHATEFICPLSLLSNSVAYVSLKFRDEECPRDQKYYLKPYFAPLTQHPGLAVCSKVAYDNYDANFLVEWFEIQRLIGVSKVLAYTYKLNKDALRVLQYYESIGFADIFPLGYPDEETIPRTVKQDDDQAFNDHYVTLFDCQERLRHYRFVAVYDKDEIVVPNVKSLPGSLITFLNEQWKQNPRLAAIRLKTKQYKISQEHDNGYILHTDRYTSCSKAVLDRPKNIYMPHRVLPGSIGTHVLTPLPGYQWQTVPANKLALHHYRSTRRSSYTHSKIQIQFDQQCTQMRSLAKLVSNSTLRIRNELSLQKRDNLAQPDL